MTLSVPQVLPAELHAFYETHFSDHATENFATHFLHPTANHLQENCAPFHTEEESVSHDDLDDDQDDGLGYYDDGVKRTLTDEQIAIFRHSELEALRRSGESWGKPPPPSAASTTTPTQQQTATADQGGAGGIPGNTGPSADGDGNLPAGQVASESTEVMKKGKKNKKKNKKSNTKNNNDDKPRRPYGVPKILGPDGEPLDLRKRTWDVVEQGLISLDYDEDAPVKEEGHAARRRKISYGDD